MGVSSARRDDRGDTWLAIAGAVVLLIGIGLVFWVAELKPGPSKSSSAADLGNDATMQELARLYPAEYQLWQDETAKALEDGASAEAIRDQRIQRTRGFVKGRILTIAAAPSEDMLLMTQISSDLEGQLKMENPQACAAFAMGTLAADIPLSDSSKAMAADLGAQMVRMAAAGERSPVARDLKTIRPADAEAFMKLVRKDGMPEREFKLLSNDLISEGTAAEQCDIAIRTNRAIAGLPIEQGARLQAYLLVSAWTPEAYSEEE